MKTCALLLLVFLAACGMSESEENRALHVAREYLRAMDRGLIEYSWDLSSTRRQALWNELRDALVGESDDYEMRWFRDATFPLFVEDRVVPATGREAYLHVVGKEERKPPIAAGPPEIEIDGETAIVRYRSRNLALGLRREDGEWKIDALGPADRGGVMVSTMASGRKVASWGWVDLTMKEIERVALPDVPGGSEFDRGAALLYLRIIVKADGTIRFKGQDYTLKELPRRLLVFAERMRDMDHPCQPSTTTVFLAAHREARWEYVQGVLYACAHHEIRIRNVTLVTEEGEWGKGIGFPVEIYAHRPGRVRVRPPEDAVLVDLPGDLKWETVLRVLVEVGAPEDRRVLLPNVLMDFR